MQPNLVKCLPKGILHVAASYTAEVRQICSEIGTCNLFRGLAGALVSILPQRGNERRMGVVLLFKTKDKRELPLCTMLVAKLQKDNTAQDMTCVSWHVLGECLHRRQVRCQDDAVQVVVVLCNS